MSTAAEHLLQDLARLRAFDGRPWQAPEWRPVSLQIHSELHHEPSSLRTAIASWCSNEHATLGWLETPQRLQALDSSTSPQLWPDHEMPLNAELASQDGRSSLQVRWLGDGRWQLSRFSEASPEGQALWTHNERRGSRLEGVPHWDYAIYARLDEESGCFEPVGARLLPQTPASVA